MVQEPLHVANPEEVVKSPYSASNRFIRALWSICYSFLYRPSPRVAHKYRVLLLRLFGGNIDWNAHPYPKCKIWLPANLTMGAYSSIADDVDCYNPAPVVVESFAVVSQYSYLCTASHDFNDVNFTLFSKPIHIGFRAWVAARSYIGPGVTVHEGAVVGANSCVYKNVPAWMIVSGNPARPMGTRTPGDSPKQP